jgi:hypothetical protein
VWEEIRRKLGLGELSYETGSWWCVPHDAVRRRNGTSFSGKSGGSGRRVVLASAYGPNATLFARSASVVTAYEHAAHVHPGGSFRCKIDEVGWINFGIPVSVSTIYLNEEYYSCEEPDSTDLLAKLADAMKP